jgi:hypothetical protein
VLYGYLDRAITETLARADEDGHENSQGYAWVWSYHARACVEAFEATGQERFLDLLTSSFDEILKHRDSERGKVDDIRGRMLHSWGRSDLEDEWPELKGKWTNVVSTPGRIGFPVLLFCKAVRQRGELQEKYAAKADQYLAAVAQAIDDFDADFRVMPDGKTGYYWRPAHGDIERLNHMLCAGTDLVLLAELTGAPKYRTMAEQLARFFRRCLWTENDAYVWGYAPSPENFTDHAGENVWKAQITVTFVPVAHDAGIEFDERDVRLFCNTFTRNVVRPDNALNGWISARLNERLRDGRRSLWTYHYLPWILFDRFDPSIRPMVEEIVASRGDHFQNGWLGHAMGGLAYAHRLHPVAKRATVASTK